MRMPIISRILFTLAAVGLIFGAHVAESALVSEPEPLVLDPTGYFVLYPEPRRNTLVLEHYTNQGVLDAVLEGQTSGALYQAAITRRLVSRLDHAAYLGRELGRAEQSINDSTV